MDKVAAERTGLLQASTTKPRGQMVGIRPHAARSFGCEHANARGNRPHGPLQVDRGDLFVGRGWMGKGKSRDCPHFATPKRDFKLSRPVLSNGDNIFLTGAGPRNCTRQSATEPLPLGVTSSVPV